MKRLILLTVLIVGAAWRGPALLAFCGFYVAKADTKLFNKASQVVLVRQGDRTVLTMANDFKGDPKGFAIVIPVPTVLQKEQIHIGEKAILDHLDAYSAPRLVEYFDEDPCRPYALDRLSSLAAPGGVAGGLAGRGGRRAQRRGGRRRRRPGRKCGETCSESRCEDRGTVYGWRVRHPDSIGAAKRRTRNLV